MKIFDFIIVGAGSAGCVLADRLSANGKHEVLLIESGVHDNDALMRMPRGVGIMNVPGGPRLSTYSVSMGGNRPTENWIKGRAVGGSSAINGMVYVRGAPGDYDQWEQMGCTGWSWADVGRCFKEMERHALGEGTWRGSKGSLDISLPPKLPIVEALIDSAEAMGVPRYDDINDVDAVSHGGIGYYPSTIYKGRRVSSATAFLKPAMRRPNLHIATGTTVSKIDVECGRVTGVCVDQGGFPRHIKSREVILSCGAIETPKLLQLSGIGCAKLLKSLGIDVVVDRPAVGQNLREHRFISMQHKVRSGSFNRAFQGFGLIGSVLAYQLFRRGPLSHAVWEAGAFIKTSPDLETANAQIGIGLYSIGNDRTGKIGGPVPIDRLLGITVGGYVMRPQSAGEMYIQSASPAQAPYINANYLSHEADRRQAVEIVKWIRALMRQPAMRDLYVDELVPGARCEADTDIIDAYFASGSAGFHVAGTCRMGADEAAVTDPRLRVRGIEGLRVIDTSIMPTMISTNTNGAAMAIGWHGAEFALADIR